MSSDLTFSTNGSSALKVLPTDGLSSICGSNEVKNVATRSLKPLNTLSTTTIAVVATVTPIIEISEMTFIIFVLFLENR